MCDQGIGIFPDQPDTQTFADGGEPFGFFRLAIPHSEGVYISSESPAPLLFAVAHIQPIVFRNPAPIASAANTATSTFQSNATPSKKCSIRFDVHTSVSTSFLIPVVPLPSPNTASERRSSFWCEFSSCFMCGLKTSSSQRCHSVLSKWIVFRRSVSMIYPFNNSRAQFLDRRKHNNPANALLLIALHL